MSLVNEKERVVHFPQRRNVFEFDEEVSKIFPDMAMRSIPMYEEAHRLHVSMFAEAISRMTQVTIYDVGASRGHFFRALCNRFQLSVERGSSIFNCVAIDNSLPMLDKLREEMPWVKTVEADAAYLTDFPEQADFICMFYILQFLRTDEQKISALRWAYRNLKPGGVLFLGQKEDMTETHERRFTDEYYRFRTANGYTMEEIKAKTAALKNSMWCSREAWLEDMCYGAGFKDYVGTTRWLMFSTSMCTK